MSSVPINPVNVDREALKAIKKVYVTNPTVSSAINAFQTILTKEKFIISGSTSSKTFGFSQSSDFLDIELTPVLNEIVKNYILYGMAVVQLGVSSVDPKRSCLVVIPITHVTIQITWNQFFQRVYSAYYLEGATSDPIPTSYVSVVDHPDERGKPQSPVALCLHRLIFGDQMWTYYVASTHKRVHPRYVFTQEESKNQVFPTGGMETQRSAIELLTTEGMGFSGAEVVYQTQVERGQEAFNRNIDTVVSQLDINRGPYPNAMRRDLGGTAIENPILDAIENKRVPEPLPLFAPVGMRVENLTNVTPPSEFVQIMAAIDNDIFRVLGFLPPGIRDAGSRFASGVDYTASILADNVRTFARKTEVQLSVCASLVLNEEFVRMVFDDLVTNELNDDIKNLKTLKAELNDREAIVYGEGNVAFNAVEVMEKITTAPKMVIKVAYGHNPMISPELALSLRDTHVITHEAYQNLMLQAMSLPPSMREKKSLEAFQAEQAALKQKPAAPPSKPKAVPAIKKQKRV